MKKVLWTLHGGLKIQLLEHSRRRRCLEELVSILIFHVRVILGDFEKAKGKREKSYFKIKSEVQEMDFVCIQNM